MLALKLARLPVALLAGWIWLGLAAAPGPLAQNAPLAAFGPELAIRGKRLWEGRGACTNCHGWAGNGEATQPYPQGANLRMTVLNADQIAEVIRCGKPATGMPFHDKDAYTDKRCYGLTAADLGAQKPAGGEELRASEIEAIVAYIVTKLKGRGAITKPECQEFFGPAASCERYN